MEVCQRGLNLHFENQCSRTFNILCRCHRRCKHPGHRNAPVSARSEANSRLRRAEWFELGAGKSTLAADAQQRSPPLPAPPSLAKEAVCEVLFLPPHMPALMAGNRGPFPHRRHSGQCSPCRSLLLTRGHFTHVTIVTGASTIP